MTTAKRQVSAINRVMVALVMLFFLDKPSLAQCPGPSCPAGGMRGTSALDDPAKMAPFYTDSSMKTMKSMDDFKSVFMAMSKEDRQTIKKDCSDVTIRRAYEDFCSGVKALGDAN